jgi:hypothetical protein
LKILSCFHEAKQIFSQGPLMKAHYRLSAPLAMFVMMTAAASVASALTGTLTTLTVGPMPGTAGAPITLTATISPQSGTLPTGTVNFSTTAAPTVIYTSPVINGAATLILEPAAGTYTYTAVYSGDSNFAASTATPVSEMVTTSTTVTLTASPNPALFGQPVTLTATVTPNTATGTVTFYDLANIVGVAPIVGGVATYTAVPLPSGLRTLYARYSGSVQNGYATSTSLDVSEAIVTKSGLGYGNPAILQTGTAPLVQVVGDFNQDGIPDLAVLNAGSSTIQIFLGTNNGSGSFTVGNTLTTGPSPVALVAGDFNGDSFLDLAVAAGDGVEVLYGTGGGAFNSYVTTTVSGEAASSLAVADFNNDGLPDIAATFVGAGGPSTTTLYILASTGSSSFNTGVFPSTLIGSAVVAAGVGEFNNDALPDLVLITSAGANVLLNTSDLSAVTPTYSLGAPAVYAAGNGPNAVLVKSVTGNTNQDLLITNFNDGTVSVLLGTGSGSFTSAGAFPTGPAPTSLASVDFTGDGIADLVVTNATPYNGTNNISIMLGNGNGTYHEPLGYSAGAGPTSVVVADFNNDAKPDLAVLSSSSNDVDILLNLYATLTVTQGNTQSAAVNNTFALPLEVTATAFGTPAANVPVTFTAPTSGPGGFFQGSGGTALALSDTIGIATAPSYTANTNAGTDIVTATAGGNTVSFMLMNNAQTCTFTVSPNAAILIDANGGAQLFTVTASLPNCMWNAASSSPSILFGTHSGTGNGVVNVLFPANTSGYDLTETLYIAGIPITATILATKQIFADVPPSAFYFDAANLMYTKGITDGCSANPLDFCPNNPVTRAEMAIFIVNSVYNDGPFTLNNSSPYFIDVPEGSFGYNQIQKMYELGITLGCAGTPGVNLQYCPDDSVNREDMAEFIIRGRYGAGTSFDIPSTPYFTDVPSGAFAYNYIQRMAYDGITEGCTATTYCPTEVVERDQMAIFIMKGLFNLDVGTGVPTQTTPEITSITPASIPLGQTTTVTVTGSNTSFDSSTVVNLVAGNQANPAYTVGAVTVNSTTSLTVQLTPVSGVDTTQPYSIYISTPDQLQEVILPNALTITPEL